MPGVVPVLLMFLFPTGFLWVEAGGCSVSLCLRNHELAGK